MSIPDRRVRVLVVEDHPDTADSVRALPEQYGVSTWGRPEVATAG